MLPTLGRFVCFIFLEQQYINSGLTLRAQCIERAGCSYNYWMVLPILCIYTACTNVGGTYIYDLLAYFFMHKQLYTEADAISQPHNYLLTRTSRNNNSGVSCSERGTYGNCMPIKQKKAQLIKLAQWFDYKGLYFLFKRNILVLLSNHISTLTEDSVQSFLWLLVLNHHTQQRSPSTFILVRRYTKLLSLARRRLEGYCICESDIKQQYYFFKSLFAEKRLPAFACDLCAESDDNLRITAVAQNSIGAHASLANDYAGLFFLDLEYLTGLRICVTINYVRKLKFSVRLRIFRAFFTGNYSKK